MYQETIAALILLGVLFVFTLGKSPVFRVDRAGAAIIGATAMTACGVLSFNEATRAIDHRTIVVLASMMVIVANLKYAGFFRWLGYLILKNVSSKRALLLATVWTGGALSAVAINDIVCLLFTPVVLLVCRSGGCAPTPYLLGLAMASNIGSAATFLGNPQNILIGSLSNVPFLTYFLTAAPVAAAGLFATYAMLAAVYRRDLSGALVKTALEVPHVHSYLVKKSLLILAAIVAFYMAGHDIALVSGLGAAALLVTRRVKPNKIYAGIDFNLLVIFIGLFVVVGGIQASGLLDTFGKLLPGGRVDGLGLFAAVSVGMSNVVSNVPAVLLLQHYIPADSAPLYWQGLALFSTLAGNLTVFGSIANLIVVEIAKRDNISISSFEYFRVGCPLTILLTAFSVLWLRMLQ